MFGRLMEGMDTDYRRALFVLFFFSLFFSFSSFALPVYLSSVGLNGYQIGVLVSLYAIASVFVTFPTGVINDKWTIRLTMVAGFFMVSVFFFGVGLFESFVIYLPLFLMGGLGNNLGDISLRTLVFKTRMEGREGKKFGTFTLIRFLSMSLGLFIGGTLVFLVGFRLGFGIMGLIYLLVTPFVSFRSPAKYTIKLSQYKKDVLNKKVIFIGVVMFMFALHWGSERTAFGLFLKKDLGLDMFMFGLYTAFALPFLGFASYYFGRRIDAGKSNLKMIYFAGMVLSGAAYILNTVPVLWFSFVTRIIHEFGDGMADIAVYFWISKLFNFERVGGGSGVMYTVMLLGQVTGSLVFGPLGEIMGYRVPIIITGVTSIMSAFLLLAYARIFKVSGKP
jgi:DHA1 family quinolone resistance protein-like MFS transporter